MNEKKKVACFFTGGYTELNAMKIFMKKINSSVQLVQLCPSGSRKSKRAITGRHTEEIKGSQSGLTGDQLIEYVFKMTNEPRFLEEEYDAILIEDDKDHRFLSLQEDGTAVIDVDKWKSYRGCIVDQLRENHPNVAIFFFLAAPEIEGWHLMDWKNSFGSVYKDILKTAPNNYFSYKFYFHVQNEILQEAYNKNIEAYGYFNRMYRKLSEELQTALASNDFLADYAPAQEHEPIRYSKRIQGEIMLEQIDPDSIAKHHTVFFSPEYRRLKEFT